MANLLKSVIITTDVVSKVTNTTIRRVPITFETSTNNNNNNNNNNKKVKKHHKMRY